VTWLVGLLGNTLVVVTPSGLSGRLVHITIQTPRDRLYCVPIAIDVARVPACLDQFFLARFGRTVNLARIKWRARFEKIMPGAPSMKNPLLGASHHSAGDWPSWALESALN
jgi:hypothetical protein